MRTQANLIIFKLMYAPLLSRSCGKWTCRIRMYPQGSRIPFHSYHCGNTMYEAYDLAYGYAVLYRKDERELYQRKRYQTCAQH
jgi:hypothetical protein